LRPVAVIPSSFVSSTFMTVPEDSRRSRALLTSNVTSQ
jgi:hypothetical protein